MRGRNREVVRTVSLSIEQGECYGLVGESGCGKSTVALAIARYLPSNGIVTGGGISVAGTDVLPLRGEALRAYHRDTFSMVYQNPGTALNPTLRISRQLTEVFELRGVSRAQATARAIEALMEVKIADPASVMTRYPHQLSGGMQQRVVIAMALATDPKLLVLDEPTTGLDATVEAEVLDLISELQKRHNTAVLFISHNLGVIGKMCRRVGVLYAGQLVEEGTVADVLQNPRHPYTVGLLRCIPQKGRRKEDGRLDTIPGFLPEIGTHLPGCVFVHRCALAAGHLPRAAAGAVPGRRAATRAAASSTSRPRACRATRPSAARCRSSTAPPGRCSGSTTSPRRSARTGATSTPSQACRRRCRRARRSGSSASRAPARPRSRARSSGSSSRRAARSRSTAASCRRSSPAARRRTSRRCRSSSRTPTPPSTGATASAACSRAR